MRFAAKLAATACVALALLSYAPAAHADVRPASIVGNSRIGIQNDGGFVEVWLFKSPDGNGAYGHWNFWNQYHTQSYLITTDRTYWPTVTQPVLGQNGTWEHTCATFYIRNSNGTYTLWGSAVCQ
ncbi:hypothetical protein [Fodinicola acaciae]|uniref:hypothetical protein n=1 Tax=Fodinicola acaciae TaxID=2681555 RepID=UPI0013D31156|nr:hypothetical protein [Fodinicola acaciae]